MDDKTVSRRDFLQAGAVAATVAATTGPLSAVGGDGAKTGQSMPRRTLGRTGLEVTILSQGEAKSNDRHLNIMHEEGVRCMDSSGWYQGGKHERGVGEWLNKTGHRKEYCLVTKDGPHTPDQWVTMLDRRLKNGRQDYYDLFLLHGMGGDDYPRGCMRWPLDREWARAADRIRKSGKARFVGFSLCCQPVARRIELMNNAVQGGWVDAIMVAADPWLIRSNAKYNKTLDGCHKAGVGLICMKEMRGRSHIKKVFPEFEARGLTLATAVLTAMWTDERFAVICSHMDNIVKLKENAAAARNFKPMTENEIGAAQRMLDGQAAGYCIGCDGSCKRAAGTETAFNHIARYLCYYEENGDRDGARRLYAALPTHARDWSKADLAAASQACVSKLDFERILARAAEKLA
ncbi:MAG: aldo/keto reductase [Planctomycetota bacterium]|jgi:predicted aldo/keto reductase-like oxidoreductase